MATLEPHVLNYYLHCHTPWIDQWSCTCDDSCPVCGKEIQPYATELNGRITRLVSKGFQPEGGFPEGFKTIEELLASYQESTS